MGIVRSAMCMSLDGIVGGYRVKGGRCTNGCTAGSSRL